MISIQIPGSYESERRYVLSVILEEFLGLEIRVRSTNRQDVLITAGSNRRLLVVDHLFAFPKSQWLQPSSLPDRPLKIWDLASLPFPVSVVDLKIPVIYGRCFSAFSFMRSTENIIILGLDIFGTAFFMLTRYEELVSSDRDRHNRFPATASLAYREGFLDRPIINEYVEILWACLKKLWPGLKRKPRHFQIYVSHDVDHPFRYLFNGVKRLARTCAIDMIRHRSPLMPWFTVRDWLKVKCGDLAADPYNTFDLIMNISEQYNLRSTFYFIADHSAGIIDGVYNVDHPVMRNLLQKINERGHEIGLHLSYNTYRNPLQTKKEFDHLKEVCVEERIHQIHWGARQHYLRWETPTTFQNLEEAGVSYDTSLAFADHAGFRCGVCYQFPTFNVRSRESLALYEHPLIVMDRTVLDRHYMNLGVEGETSLRAIEQYKNQCRMFDGDFTLLWHNNRFVDEREIKVYKSVLSI